MFGHLKPEDFINLIEGGRPPALHQTHLDSCARCRETWEALKPMHGSVTSLDEEIAEPDWMEFRSAVRDQLLSRSIQRQTAAHGWARWATRPALAWALSLMLTVGLTTVAVVWHMDHQTDSSAAVETFPVEPAIGAMDAVPDKSLFDDLNQLGDEEQDQLRHMLESAQKESPLR